MAPHNKSIYLGSCLLAGALIFGSVAQVLADDLNAAHKAVRMQQYREAVKLFERAAEGGHAEAQYQLGNLYMQGRGAEKDPQQATHWFEQAAEQGHAGAQYALAQVLLTEEPERAHSLLTAAAGQGYRSAVVHLERQSPVAIANQNAPFEVQWLGAARKNDVALMKALLAEHDALGTIDDAGRTALFYAVQGGSEAAVKWLIEQGSNVNHRDQAGLTPLQTAVERDRTALLRLLLDAGADKHQMLSNGDNLLHYALRRRHFDQAKILIEQGVGLNHRNKDGLTPLDLAQQQNAKATAALLAKRGAIKGGGWRTQERQTQNIDAVVEQLESGRMAPLARAIINGNRALVDHLLAQDPDLANKPLADGTTPLILAIKHGKPEAVRSLIEHHVQVNQIAYRGVNAIQVAARLGDLTIMEMLIDAGAIPVHTDDQGRDAVMSAIELDQFAAASLLLDEILGDGEDRLPIPLQLGQQYAPVDRYILLASQQQADEILDRLLPYATATPATDQQNRTALWFAARDGRVELIGKLLEAGLPADTADIHGRTPFLMAAASGCLECAKQLLPVSDINHQSDTGNTALMMAAGNGDTAMSKWLIQNRADVELRNQRGDTALMLAVLGNSPAVVQSLLAADASVTRKNKLGFSSIDLASEVSPQMLELVKSKAVLGIF